MKKKNTQKVLTTGKLTLVALMAMGTIIPMAAHAQANETKVSETCIEEYPGVSCQELLDGFEIETYIQDNYYQDIYRGKDLVLNEMLYNRFYNDQYKELKDIYNISRYNSNNRLKFTNKTPNNLNMYHFGQREDGSADFWRGDMPFVIDESIVHDGPIAMGSNTIGYLQAKTLNESIINVQIINKQTEEVLAEKDFTFDVLEKMPSDPEQTPGEQPEETPSVEVEGNMDDYLLAIENQAYGAKYQNTHLTLNVKGEQPIFTKTVWEAIQNIGVTTVVNTNGHTWTFSMDTTFSNDIDLTMHTGTAKDLGIKNVSADTFVLNFAHEGDLPNGTTLKTYVGDIFKAGDKVKVSYLNEKTGKLEETKEYTVDVNSYLTVSIEHCSNYVVEKVTGSTVNNGEGTHGSVTLKPEKDASIIKQTGEQTTNALFVLSVAGIALGVVAGKRKRA